MDLSCCIVIGTVKATRKATNINSITTLVPIAVQYDRDSVLLLDHKDPIMLACYCSKLHLIRKITL